MFCSKCGQQCADGIKFCTSCGAELVQATPAKNTEEVAVAQEAAPVVAPAVQEEAPKVKKEKPVKEKKPVDTTFIKSLLMKKPVWIGAAAVVLLIVVACLFLGGDEKSKNFEYSGKTIANVGQFGDDDTYSVMFLDGSMLALDEEYVYNMNFSLDRKTMCFRNDMDELIVVKDGKIIKTGIEEGRGVVVSDKGDSFSYYTDVEYMSYSDDYGYSRSVEVGVLNLYMIKDKKNYEIAEEVVTGTAVLSPNGQTVAYVADYEGETDFKGYYCVKGKEPKVVGKEKKPFALADKGAYIYYMDEDRVYVMNSKGDAEKLASDIGYYFEIYFNSSRTEALYNSDGRAYLSIKGGAKQKLSSASFSDLVMKDSVVVDEDDFYGDSCELTSIRVGLDTFVGKLLYNYSNDTIMYIKKATTGDKEYTAEKVATSVNYYVAAANNKSLMYTEDGDIWKVTGFNEGGKPTKMTTSGEAYRIYGAGNLEHVYFESYDDTLYYLSGKKGKKIADDVTSVVMSSDGKYCYYVVDYEELYVSTEGGKGKKVVTADELDIENMAGYVYVETEMDDVYTIYLMSGSKKKEVYSYEESYYDYDDYDYDYEY